MIKRGKIINLKIIIKNIFLFDIYILYKINKFWKLIIIFILIIFAEYKKITSKEDKELNKYYLQVQLDLNLTFYNHLKKKINLGIYCNSIKNGGIERLTALLLNYLYNVKIFNLFLITLQKKEENEYSIPIEVKRIIINSRRKNELINILNKENIDILIYHFYNAFEIEELNNLKNTKSIFYNHSCFLIWIYAHFYYYFKTIYNAYKNSKFVISLVLFENGYLFKKWGINSIFMNNFIHVTDLA